MPVQITPFTTSPSRTSPATFSADMDTRLSQENSRIVEMNLQSDENNAINVNVNAKESSATLSASTAITASDLALANANFKGVWNSASSYAVPSSVYYNGEYFIALSSSSNQTPTPLAATAYWAPYSIAFQITNATAKTTPIDADVFGFLDSAASMILKKLTWANIKAAMKTYTDTLYVALTGAQTVAGVKTFSSNPLSSAAQDTAITALTRKDYVDTALGLKAPISSPIFTGTPTAPNFSYKPTPVTVTSWGYVATTITLNVASHTLVSGDYIEVSGLTATTNAPNGVHLVTSVTATTIVFTYSLTPTGTAGVSSATVKGYFTTNGRVESIGVGQTIQDVTASRVSGTIYTNTTGRTKYVTVYTSGTYTRLACQLGGFTVNNGVDSGALGAHSTISVIVPNDITYSFTVSGGTIVRWLELA